MIALAAPAVADRATVKVTLPKKIAPAGTYTITIAATSTLGGRRRARLIPLIQSPPAA